MVVQEGRYPCLIVASIHEINLHLEEETSPTDRHRQTQTHPGGTKDGRERGKGEGEGGREEGGEGGRDRRRKRWMDRWREG